MLKTLLTVVLSTTFALFAGSTAEADWSYRFLTLEQLIQKSDLVVVAELQVLRIHYPMK